MLAQCAFDLDGGDIFPRPADDVLAPVDEVKRAVRTLSHDVAGMKPFAFPGFGGGVGVLQIFPEETKAPVRSGMAHQKFALFAAVDPALHIRARPAEAICSDMAGFLVCGDDGTRTGLGHRPRLDQWKAEAGFERGVQFAVNAGAETKTNMMRLVVGRQWIA